MGAGGAGDRASEPPAAGDDELPMPPRGASACLAGASDTLIFCWPTLAVCDCEDCEAFAGASAL